MVDLRGAFDLDLDLVCAREATFMASLMIIYLKTTFLVWKPDMVLPPVNFVFCSQWLPPLSNNILHCGWYKFCWRRRRSLDLPRPGAVKACLFPSSMLTWAEVLI
jgi:hypothetical protein